MGMIKVENGLEVVMVDDIDQAYIQSMGPWRVSKHGYVYSINKTLKVRKLHLLIADRMALPRSGMHIDHTNYDKLDMRRGNLRVLSVKASIEHRRSNPRRGFVLHPRKHGMW